MAAEKDNLTPAEHAATVRDAIVGTSDPEHWALHEEEAIESLSALLALAERATELERQRNGAMRDAVEFGDRAERAEMALRELDDWVSRMPDAGFNQDSPRWDWWHQRPRAALGETAAVVGVPGVTACADHRSAARCQRDHESGRCICRAALGETS